MRTGPLVLIAFCALLVSSSVFAAGPIASGTTVPGSVGSPSYLESWTFSGTAGNRVIVTAIATSGLLNTSIVLKAPGGAVEANTNSGDRLDWQLAATGTYTIEVQDYGLNDTGTYAMGLLNVTAGPLTGGGDTDGGAIISADVHSGTMSGPADLDAFTFTASVNHRILVDAVATSGVGYNTYISLYPPNGGAAVTYTSADRLEYQLATAGTWTIVIEDNGDDTAGGYSMSMLNVTAGPLTSGGDADGGPIASTQVLNGGMQVGVDFDAFTFFGFAGTRVYIHALATSGTLNTSLTLYPPNGMPAEVASNSGDVIDWQLAASGTYTVVVEDYGNDHTGDYIVGLTNITAGPFTGPADDGGPIATAEVKNGTISAVGDVDVYTILGNFGERLLIDAVATSGASFNTYIAVYPPAGGPSVAYTSADRVDMQLTASGTWTIMIADNGLDNTGGYAMSVLNIAGPLLNSSDPNGGPIASSEIKTGQFQQGVDFDAFTFSGTASSRVIIVGLATGAGTHNTSMTLYPPNGGPAEVATNSGDVIDAALLASGTYTVVIEDYGNDNPGTYTISYLNLGAGPLTNAGDTDGGPIASAEVRTGSTAVADMDAFTFTGNAGDRVLFDAVATSGGSYNTYMALYPPNGGVSPAYTSADRMEYQLTASGTWTLLVMDNGFDHSGTYELSILDLTSGPLTTAGDPDGGTILSNEIKTGQFHQGTDFDVFSFTGSAGQRVVLTAVATGGGSQNTTLTLYPPLGYVAEAASNSGDRLEWQLLRSGTYKVVVEDYGNDNAGGYTLSLLNVTAGPYTNGGDANGGAIVSNQVVSGTMSGVGDLDAYTFYASYGQRVLVAAVATSGAGFNTNIALYPPGGAASPSYTSADRLDYRLNAGGTWTLVIEDSGDDTPGAYTMSMVNLTAGPYSGSGETDGDPIADNVPRNGSIYSVSDTDAYTFWGVAGMTANITAVATSGTLNTQLTLFPPNGQTALQSTTADNVAPVLPTNGYYTLVIDDYLNDETGNYTVTVDLSGGVTGVDDTPPVVLALHPAVPSPFSQSTRFDYDLPKAGHVRLDVYDVAGRRVRTLADEDRAAGHHGATWDGRDARGEHVASGVYYLRMETRTGVKQQKVVLVR